LILGLVFPQGNYRNHDPHGLVKKNCSYISWSWPYPQERWNDEFVSQYIYSMNEAEEILKDEEYIILNTYPWKKSKINLKYLSLEEKQDKLEKKLEVAK
jgi:hypothetical protein